MSNKLKTGLRFIRKNKSTSIINISGLAVGMAVAILIGLAIIIAAPLLPASIVVALGALLIAGLVGMSWYFFVAHNLLIDFTYPLMSCWLIYLVLTFFNYFREQQQRQQIRSAFGFYLSPQLVEQLARSPAGSVDVHGLVCAALMGRPAHESRT